MNVNESIRARLEIYDLRCGLFWRCILLKIDVHDVADDFYLYIFLTSHIYVNKLIPTKFIYYYVYTIQSEHITSRFNVPELPRKKKSAI